MPFNWSEESRRYRDLQTGRFLPAQTVRSAVDTVVSASGQRYKAMAAQVRAGTLSIPDFQQSLAQDIKALHLATAAASRGGWQQMSASDFLWTGRRLKSEYAYLNNFAAEIASGRQPLNGTLEARAALYAEAARSTSREMARRMGAVFGDGSERSVLGAADHCPGCLDATGRGWVEIGSLPAVGARDCRSRCHCRIETRAQPADAETAIPAEPEPVVPTQWDWADTEQRVDMAPRPANPGWEAALSDSQREAVKNYTTGGYRDLNESLRDNIPLSASQQQLATHLDSVISAAGIYAKPPTVWRGINMGGAGMPSGADLVMADDREALIRKSLADYAETSFKPGSVVQLGGYQSTSFQTQPALDASLSSRNPGLIFEIRANRGAYLSSQISNFDDEAELLLSNNSRFRVVGVLRDVEFENAGGGISRRTVIKLVQES